MSSHDAYHLICDDAFQTLRVMKIGRVCVSVCVCVCVCERERESVYEREEKKRENVCGRVCAREST